MFLLKRILIALTVIGIIVVLPLAIALLFNINHPAFVALIYVVEVVVVMVIIGEGS